MIRECVTPAWVNELDVHSILASRGSKIQGGSSCSCCACCDAARGRCCALWGHPTARSLPRAQAEQMRPEPYIQDAVTLRNFRKRILGCINPNCFCNIFRAALVAHVLLLLFCQLLFCQLLFCQLLFCRRIAEVVSRCLSRSSQGQRDEPSS